MSIQVENNIKNIPKLLRAMAKSTQAVENKQDIILNEAANLIEFLASYRAISIELYKELKNG